MKELLEDLGTYEIDADLMVRIFEILDALNDIKETLPPNIVALMECFHDEDEAIH